MKLARIFLFFLPLGVLLCGGCSHPVVDRQFRASMPAAKSLMHDVQVIQTGPTTRFVLLSDHIFYGNSANIRQNSYPILRSIAERIADAHPHWVSISVYTDAGPQPHDTWSQLLTNQQAQVLVKFFSTIQMGTRLLSGKGYGDQHPVDSHASPMGRMHNRRIEISFMDEHR